VLPLLAGITAACAESGKDSKMMDTLTGSTWLAEDIDGRGVLDGPPSTLSFEEGQRVAGSAGCNRFTGTAATDGERLRFGPLAVTKRMCPPAVMDQEQRFLTALMAAEQYRLTEQGFLVIQDATATPRLRFSRSSVDTADG
jgi:heat shock protein HslJ